MKQQDLGFMESVKGENIALVLTEKSVVSCKEF